MSPLIAVCTAKADTESVTLVRRAEVLSRSGNSDPASISAMQAEQRDSLPNSFRDLASLLRSGLLGRGHISGYGVQLKALLAECDRLDWVRSRDGRPVIQG